MRILIVEDDDVLAQTLNQHLTSQHYAVDVATDGESGWDYIQSVTYDLILLDIDLPLLDGISLCKRLRDHRHDEPVLLLTARSQVANRVQGLDAGADDYLVKPYSLDELLARVRALLRRQGQGSGLPLLEWGPFCLDPKICELTVEKEAIALSPKEYQLMELFLRHPQQVLSSDRILDHIWGFDDIPGKDTVRTHMRRLRKKLKPVGVEHWIETVYGLGYRLKSQSPEQQDCNTDTSLSIENSSSAQPQEASPGPVPPVSPPEQQDSELSKSLDSMASASISSEEAVRQASLSLWPKFRPKALEHLALLNEAIASLEQAIMPHLQSSQGLTDEDLIAVAPFALSELSLTQIDRTLHRHAERAAHKLVGTLGMFGMPEGSELAGEMEGLFQQLSPPLPPDFRMVAMRVNQLRLKCTSLQHLLGVGTTQQLGMDGTTGLLSYPHALRDLSKYFCLARRHHHTITLGWIRFIAPNACKTGSPDHSGSPFDDSSQELRSVQACLNPLLLSWALSVKQSLREEDIVTQTNKGVVLLALYACSRENALRRLKPFLKQLVNTVGLALQKENKCGVNIESSSNVLHSCVSLAVHLAEFPQDGPMFETLEAMALNSTSYMEPINILKVCS